MADQHKIASQDQETRKGPWTEQEDFQLVCFVGLFGDRRWDFIAKVSGLNRTGKSCRLRWVNYLHPGLKRGKMTPLEERLVLELHAKWGNRWSRIARKLPGRTDNEIKNYWRTHMRKKAQEKKRANGGSSSTNAPPSPSPSSSSDHSNSNSKRSSSSSSSNITTVDSLPFHDSTTGVESFYDTGGRTDKKPAAEDAKANFYSMDDIWKAISLPEVNALANMVVDHPLYGTAETVLQGSSEIIENDAALGQFDQFYCSDSLWKMDDEASNAFFCGGFGAGETLTSGS